MDDKTGIDEILNNEENLEIEINPGVIKKVPVDKMNYLSGEAEKGADSGPSEGNHAAPEASEGNPDTYDPEKMKEKFKGLMRKDQYKKDHSIEELLEIRKKV